MKSSKLSSIAVAALCIAVSARAAHVDMTDPRRALGREDDVRVDAQLIPHLTVIGPGETDAAESHDSASTR